MKAIDLLDIVNCQCTSQESYGVYKYFAAKHHFDLMNFDELKEYMRDYFLGTDGEVLDIDYFALLSRRHLVAIYPTKEDDFYHDFFPLDENLLFMGKMSNGQYVFICELE